MNANHPDSQFFKTHCARMDHGGCGLIVEVKAGRIIKIKGDPQCPINYGYICPKALASPERTTHPDRLTVPLLRRGPAVMADSNRLPGPRPCNISPST